LLVSGWRQSPSRRLEGDSDWQTVAVEFELTGVEDIELVGEFRATRGEAWFDTASLRLIRLPTSKK